MPYTSPESYGLMGGIGNALSQGVNTFLKAKGQKDDLAQSQQQLALKAQEAGYTYDPETQQLTPGEGLLAIKALKQKQAQEGLDEYDKDSDTSKNRVAAAGGFLSQINPNFKMPDNLTYQDMKAIAPFATTAAKAESAKQSNQSKMDFRDDQLQERNDFRAHQQNLNKIKTDKVLNDAAVKSTNLDNVIKNVEKTGVITTQDMGDIQSIAIDSMGMKGQSSVGERADRYAKTLGMKGDQVLQFMTGQLQDIGKDNPLYQRYKDIMAMEVENYRDRAQKRIDFLSGGNKSMYQRHTDDFRPDIDALKEQFAAQLPAKPISAGAPQGLLNQGQSPGGFPRKLINQKTGAQATVNNPQELQEATNEGFQ